MDFLAIIISLLVLKYIGSASRLHFDGWFESWLAVLDGLKKSPLLHFLVAVIIPCAFLVAIYLSVGDWFWGGAELALSVCILLYSVGGGKYKSLLREYQQQWRSGEEVSVADIQTFKQALLVSEQIVEEKIVDSEITESNETPIIETPNIYHQHFTLREAIFYAGFERVFVVLFWFALLGPVAAFLYRLIVLFIEKHNDNSPAHRLLFVLEWPAARLIGLCYGVVGDFVKVLHVWLSLAANLQAPNKDFINSTASAALNFQAQWLSEDFVSARNTAELAKFAADEIEQMLALYNRALVCMLVFVAFVEIIA